ncbi:MAG TPA: M48 family metallopeptidase [Chitinophaga sp.]|nr:M48 family metallopeptidase [Chitinophaga sp.]
MKDFLYPDAPAHIDASKLVPSAGFRKQAVKVIIGIVLFLLTYLTLLAAAIALAILCCWAGIWVITANFSTMAIILGAGLLALGLSVLFFMVKFIFAVSKDENSGRVEITEEQQPRLFTFIRQLTFETNTPFPNKIYLSPEVNACVFYNSSFWSMFLPVRKNLEIGLGLVNSINISEFKAVMAHEFGHFSQRSMKLGSFTYNANRIIHNMLYDNKGYTAFLEKWAGIDGVLSIMAVITVKIAEGIQWILRGIYKLINKNYMALSREMEFHADTIAASVAGGNNLVTALSRIEVAGGCYSVCISTASERLKEKKITRNIFQNQLAVFRTLVSKHGLVLKEGLPEVTSQFINSFSSSRINYKDQWASHPSLEERTDHLESAGMDVVPDQTTAWAIFDNTAQLQEELTQKVYRSVELEKDLVHYDAEEFEKWYIERREAYRLPDIYKGFYDERYISIKDWNLNEVKDTAVPASRLEEFFTEENGRLYTAIRNNESDLSLLKAIQSGQMEIDSFDFDGKKYKRKDTAAIISGLETEIAAGHEKLALLEKQAFAFFYRLSENKEVLLEQYQRFMEFSKRTENFTSLLNRISQVFQPFFKGSVSFQQAEAIIGGLKENEEKELKQQLQSFIEEGIITESSPDNLLKRCREFVQSQYTYFGALQLYNEELNTLHNIGLPVLDELEEVRFRYYKQMLLTQLDMHKRHTAA